MGHKQRPLGALFLILLLAQTDGQRNGKLVMLDVMCTLFKDGPGVEIIIILKMVVIG